MAKIRDWEWLDYAELGSTNDKAKEISARLQRQKFVVTARVQTAGRGRRGRSWTSIPGNLFMSMGVEIAPRDWGQLVFVVSLSLLETLLALHPCLQIKLKWPNDVLINGGKISGILLEKGEGDYIIIGVGVNIVEVPALPGMVYPTESLSAAGLKTSPDALLKSYLLVFDNNLKTWQTQGFSNILNRWLKHARGVGEVIQVNLEKESKTGIFLGLDDNGLLLLQNGDKIEKICAGDIFFKKN